MRGQISIEAVMVIGMAIVILTSLFNINMERLSMAEDLGEAAEGRMTGELLATAINTGYANGEGFNLYLGGDKLNFSTLSAIGVDLPITINKNSRTMSIRKNMTTSGGEEWSVNVRIIPANLLQTSPTSQYPEVTVFNNGTDVIIYANDSNIIVQ